jgi:hypothetical protein
MKDYNIVSLPTDYSILEANLNKLHFIKGVAIYYDKTKTNREVFNKFTNFNAWLEEYAREHAIPFFEFRALIKSLVNEVQAELLESFEPDKIFSIPEDFMERLNKIKAVGPAGDPYSYHTVLSLVWRYLPIENNISLVHKDGVFLMSKNFMILPWFYNNIEINDYGLFKLEKREYGYDRCFPGSIKTSNSIYYWDTEGHFMSSHDFKELLNILANCKNDFLILLEELVNSKFKLVGPKSNGWRENDGKEEVKWGVEREDGLRFYSEEYRRTGSDSYTDFEYVGDKFENSMYLNDFFTGLKMLKNGGEYLNELKKDFVEQQTNK